MLNTVNLLKLINFKTENETYFANDAQSVGRLDEEKCFQACNDDFACFGVKIKNGICYTTSHFDPLVDDACLSTEKCYSVQSK